MLIEETENLAAAAKPPLPERLECVQVDVPELRDHGVLQSPAAEGLLFLLGDTTGAVHLLNPLTHQVASLPPVAGLGDGFTPEFIGGGSRSTAGLTDASTVVLYFFHGRTGGTLAFAKPGDERWVVVETGAGTPLMPTNHVFRRPLLRRHHVRRHAGGHGRREESVPPRLVVAAKLARPFSRMEDSVHLVDNGGKPMLVYRMTRSVRSGDGGRQFKWAYKVYQVDLDAGKTTTRGSAGLSLGSRAVFIDVSVR